MGIFVGDARQDQRRPRFFGERVELGARLLALEGREIILAGEGQHEVERQLCVTSRFRRDAVGAFGQRGDQRDDRRAFELAAMLARDLFHGALQAIEHTVDRGAHLFSVERRIGRFPRLRRPMRSMAGDADGEREARHWRTVDHGNDLERKPTLLLCNSERRDRN